MSEEKMQGTAAEATASTAGAGASGQVAAIIGWGTAGVNAAIALRAAGYAGTIRAFSDTDILPYSPILTSYYAGGEKTYEECFPWSAEALAELNVEVVPNAHVAKLDPAAHRIVTAAGAEYAYDTCLVAVGARPSAVGFPQDCGYEPLVLRTMDDAARMKTAFGSPACKRVLVSGASMIALKSVEAALNCGLEVSLVGVNDHVLDFSALPVAAERFERGLAAKGVQMRFGQSIAGVRVLDGEDAEGGRLEVAFSGGDVECFDEIVVAHGVRSDLSLLDGSGIAVDRAIVVDDFMRTSVPGVFAAGDCAQATELITGEKRVLGIWKTAALQGQCAGRAMAAELAGGEPAAADAYRGAIMTNTIAVNGTLFISAGLVDPREIPGVAVEVQETDDMTVVRLYENGQDDVSCEGDICVEAGCGEDGATKLGPGARLVGFNVVADEDEPGGTAYDVGAMLSLRIEEACRR